MLQYFYSVELSVCVRLGQVCICTAATCCVNSGVIIFHQFMLLLDNYFNYLSITFGYFISSALLPTSFHTLLIDNLNTCVYCQYVDVFFNHIINFFQISSYPIISPRNPWQQHK